MIIVLLLGIAVVTLLWNGYYRQNWYRHVTVTLWFETQALYAGETTKLFEVIENRKAMPIPVLEVGFHAKKELDFAHTENASVSDYIYKRDIFSVLGRQKITREIPLTCTKRGRYEIKEADITSYSLFYRKRFSRAVENCEYKKKNDAGIETNASIKNDASKKGDISIKNDASIENDAGTVIYVYPKMTDVSQLITVCEHMLGTIQCAKRLYEDPFAFRTIRGYTAQDPMKTINWKASAKTGSLMVNTFDSVMSQKAMIFLDVEDNGILRREDLVEESIAVAATLMRRLLRQSIEVGLCMNGMVEGFDTFLAPTNNKGKLVQIERMLAEFQASGDITNCTQEFVFPFVQRLETVFEQFRPPEDMLLIFITKNLDEMLRDKIKNMIGQNQTLIIYPVRRGEGQRIENTSLKSRENLRIVLRELG